MKKAILAVLLFPPTFGSYSQNLVPNPSFEDDSYGGCPTDIGQIWHAAPWQTPAVHLGQSDYFSTCGTGGTDVPSNNLGYEFPATGAAYAGLYAWTAYPSGTSANYREYLQTTLPQPLVNGYVYRVSLKCSYENTTVHNSYPIFTDAIGILLATAVPNSAPNPFGPLPYVPQYQGITEIPPTGWAEVGFDFAAAGGEKYLVLGNFKNDASTSVTPFPDPLPTPVPQTFYFYIDDVSIERLPYIPIAGDTLICLGDTAQLTAGNSLSFAWATSADPNSIIGNQATLTVAPTVTSTYYVYGDTYTDTVTVEVLNPVANLGNDTGLCAGQTLMLDATFPNAGYLWQDLSTAATFLCSQAGTYTVTVTAGACVAVDSIQVQLYPSPSVNLGPDIQACSGIPISLNAWGSNLSYQWNDSSTNSMYQVFENGNYVVQVTNPLGCRDADSVAVLFVDSLSFDFPDSTLCIGEVWQLDISSPYTDYLWQDKYTGPNYTIQSDGSYWAMAGNACGTITDSMEVRFKQCHCHLYIPNSFTPDGNTTNERFSVIPTADCNLKQYTLSIFNRFGELVFESQNPDFTWNGTLNGQVLPMDVYAYRVTYTFEQSPQTYEWGHVTLVR